MAAKVFIISAPSGAGKTTLVNAVLQQFDRFAFSVSATTRPPRHYEQDGIHYHFLSLEAFQQKIKEDAFLECEEVYPGRWYGTLKSEVDRILSNGSFPIFDVDVEGGLRIKEEYGDEAVAIFIQPPSPETLLERLRNRDSDGEEEIQKRYAKSRRELAYAPQFDHVIVNDDLAQAKAELKALIQRELEGG
jgi:guanylate kinase